MSEYLWFWTTLTLLVLLLSAGLTWLLSKPRFRQQPPPPKRRHLFGMTDEETDEYFRQLSAIARGLQPGPTGSAGPSFTPQLDLQAGPLSWFPKPGTSLAELIRAGRVRVAVIPMPGTAAAPSLDFSSFITPSGGPETTPAAEETPPSGPTPLRTSASASASTATTADGPTAGPTPTPDELLPLEYVLGRLDYWGNPAARGVPLSDERRAFRSAAAYLRAALAEVGDCTWNAEMNGPCPLHGSHQ